MKRRAALKRSGHIERRTALPKKRRRPRLVKLEDGTKARKDEVEFGPQAKVCRRLMCCVCFRHLAKDWGLDWLPRYRAYAEGGGRPYWRSEAHHEEHTRGSGRGRDEHTIPLCRRHHDERGASTREDFERRHDIDLFAVVRLMREVVYGPA